MTHPKRIQRKRTKGWRKPEGAVYVGRGSDFGNPYRIGDSGIHNNADAVSKFMGWVYGDSFGATYMRGKIKTELRGESLMCWCPQDQPCHADVLLKIANEVGQ
jgi:hypothetical protein